jgi:uncharacterized protein
MKFVCDVMLGKLAKYLRVFGLDTIYAKTGKEFNKYMALDEGTPPYLFTRRVHVRSGDRTILVRSDRPRDQLKEVWHIINLYVDTKNIMGRCIECNVPLIDVVREDVEPHVPEFIFHRYNSFKQCPSCRKVYWSGTHSSHMLQFIKEVGFDRVAK